MRIPWRELQEWEEWRADAHAWLRHDAPKVVLALLLALILVRLLRVITRRLARLGEAAQLVSRRRAHQLRTLAGVLYGVGLFAVLFVTALEILPLLGINIGPLLAGAGIAGLALGFGAQTLVHDVINGFFLLMENQYDVGDAVKIGAVSGTVEFMTLRRTVLRDDNGTLHNIPNSEVKVVSNLTRDWAQLSLLVAVANEESSDRVVTLLERTAREACQDPRFSNSVVGEPQVLGIERTLPGEVDYLLQVRTWPGQQYGIARELRRRIKESFEKHGVQTPNPLRAFLGDWQHGVEVK